MVFLVGDRCDPRGSLSTVPDRGSGSCSCKVCVITALIRLALSFVYSRK